MLYCTCVVKRGFKILLIRHVEFSMWLLHKSLNFKFVNLSRTSNQISCGHSRIISADFFFFFHDHLEQLYAVLYNSPAYSFQVGLV